MVDGRCTGKSKLPWQYETGQYTSVCPKRVVSAVVRAYNLWASVHDFGVLPVAGGVYEQPARWMKIIRLCESEHNRRRSGEQQ